MKAPDIIYTDGGNTCAPAPIFSNNENVKYIRADLAELTCEDIESIFRIADNYDSEFYRAKYLSKGYCKEILQRFLKSKTQQGCSPY